MSNKEGAKKRLQIDGASCLYPPITQRFERYSRIGHSMCWLKAAEKTT